MEVSHFFCWYVEEAVLDFWSLQFDQFHCGTKYSKTRPKLENDIDLAGVMAQFQQVDRYHNRNFVLDEI